MSARSESSSDSDSPTIPYVRLTVGKRAVILPVPAAMGSKMLCDLITGLVLQRVHAQACTSQPAHLEDRITVIGGDCLDYYKCHAVRYLPPLKMETTSPETLQQVPDGECHEKDELKLLSIPLTCLEFDTLVRISEALVASTTVKATSNARYHDVLHDLDRGKSEDQKAAICLLLGADFLGC